MPIKKVSYSRRLHGVRNGYRSGLEEEIADLLDSYGVPYEYESFKIKYVQPEQGRTYTPDFILHNGIIIETKGIFSSEDRKKHLLIQKQLPHLDIRFVFSSANARIYKGSTTRNRDWCDQHGFQWAHRTIPKAWLREKRNEERIYKP
jgi:hypothetical protein